MKIHEINQRIDKVMKTDATFAREADFMLTHVPFKKLYDFIPESGQTNFDGGQAHYYINPDDYRGKASFSEDELLARFSDQPDSHKFYLVQGNSGTGKSNLIRWIYYMYKHSLDEANDKSEQIIFIERSYNSLKDAVKRILDYKILPLERTRYYLDKIGGGGQEATGEELAATVFAMLQIVIKFDNEYDKYLENEDIYNGLKSIIEDENIRKYIFMKEKGPIDRICQRISGNRSADHESDEDNEDIGNDIFEEADFNLNFGELIKILKSDGHNPTVDVMNSVQALLINPANRHAVVRYLNSLTEKVVARSSTLDATDVQGIFREIRRELHNEDKNLTLFIEDINAYTGMDRALIEILIEEEVDDSSKEMCRLKSMVGSTDNFYDLLHTSLKVRITDSIVVLDESVLSDNNKLLEFAAYYINAVNLSESQVDEWYKNKGEIPVAPLVNKVTSVEVDGKMLSIYPFTKEAVINLFSCLDANYKTPRGLLKFVVKHILTTWNTMEDKMFESPSSFTNIAIRTFSPLALPHEVRNSIREMSEKEKQYIQIWGFDYIENKMVNNSDNERNLFKINVAEDVVLDKPQTQDNPSVRPIKPQTSKKDKALNHIEEWEKGINDSFVLHKDIRDWMGKYILGQINWQHEGILYSKAEEVCKSLSFIKIEGHEGQGNAELVIERNSENADFFRSLIYWNYDGEKKNWNFPGGIEEKIIAKVWLISHKNEIIEAVKRYGKLQQITPEYVVKANIYASWAMGMIRELSCQSVVDALVHCKDDRNANVVSLNEKVVALSKVLSGRQQDIYSLFKEYFFRVVGSSDVTAAKYTYVDRTYLDGIVEDAILEIKEGKDKQVSVFGDKKLEPTIDVINIYHQEKDDIRSVSDSRIRRATVIFEDAFGKNITETIVASAIHKMKQYLSFVNKGLNQVTPPDLIRELEDGDSIKRLITATNVIKKYKSGIDSGEKWALLSNLDIKFIQVICDEIEAFDKFMKEIDKKFASNVNKNVEKDIDELKENIKRLVDSIIASGGDK